MTRLSSALFGGLLLCGLLGVAGPAAASGTGPHSGDPAAVDALLESIEGLARAFGDACEERESSRTVTTSPSRPATIHRRMVAEVERLRLAAADADHRTARRILSHFNDVAFSFARNYLGPGEEVIEAGRGPEAKRALRRYREAVSRMKSNLFGWNPDLEALLADLAVVTGTVEAWIGDDSHSTSGVPIAGL